MLLPRATVTEISKRRPLKLKIFDFRIISWNARNLKPTDPFGVDQVKVNHLLNEVRTPAMRKVQT